MHLWLCCDTLYAMLLYVRIPRWEATLADSPTTGGEAVSQGPNTICFFNRGILRALVPEHHGYTLLCNLSAFMVE